VHEFCHALVAFIGGDKSVKDKGYLTFNVFKYTDPTLTLVLPIIILMLGGIALPGAAVYIDHSRLRNRFWESAVSAAGPLGTLLVTYVLSLPFQFGVQPPAEYGWIYPALSYSVLLNIVAFLLNSLPIPPLDGYGFIEPWLPGFIRKGLDELRGVGIFVVFGALWLIRPLNQLLWSLAAALGEQYFNLPLDLVRTGYEQYDKDKMYLIVFIIGAFILSKRKR